MTHVNDWPKSPIWPQDLPLIRQLMTDDDFAELLSRLIPTWSVEAFLGRRTIFGNRAKN